MIGLKLLILTNPRNGLKLKKATGWNYILIICHWTINNSFIPCTPQLWRSNKLINVIFYYIKFLGQRFTISGKKDDELEKLQELLEDMTIYRDQRCTDLDEKNEMLISRGKTLLTVHRMQSKPNLILFYDLRLFMVSP